MGNFLTLLKQSDISETSAIRVTDGDTKQIQKRLLNIFDDILSVCNQNEIAYQLGGGSALGAVRHQGFIPWDDDIDINMTRTEFDRFLPLFREQTKDKYWVHVLGETPGYDLIMVHIVDKQVRAREIMDAERAECGLCIDIFIMENTFDNVFLRDIHGAGCMALRYALSCVRFQKNKEELEQLGKNNPELRKYVKKRAKLGRLLAVVPESAWAKLCAKWEKLCNNSGSNYVVIPGGQYQFFREMYVRKVYCETVDMLFEGRKVKVSADYNRYLENLYGDYMTIPPKEKRQQHIMMELDREALSNCEPQEACGGIQ